MTRIPHCMPYDAGELDEGEIPEGLCTLFPATLPLQCTRTTSGEEGGQTTKGTHYKTASSLACFKIELKTHLFKKVFL